MELKGKTAIITGGASGLGEAAARRFVAAGANVVLADVNDEKGQALANELGEQAIYVNANIAEEDSVEALCDAAVAKFGTIHVLIHSAGIAWPGRTLGKSGPLDLTSFRTVINVDLIGTFIVISRAAWIMSKNELVDGERGVIVDVASVAAFDGQIGQAAYSAAKGGVAAMTLPIARDLYRDGIRVNTIAPGIFETPMMAAMPEPARKALELSVPFPQRLGAPDEFAKLAQSIVENNYLNGECIRLDGAIRMAPK